MIFADKLIDLRKKAGLSQEELADKLGVSRQAVSKWEGAQSIPDINKIIELSKIFGVSTDYLLKDEIEEAASNKVDDNVDNIRKVTLEEATNYLNTVEKTRYKISLATFLCIISPITLLVLAQLNETSGLGDTLASIIGLVALFVLVAIAVILFIVNGSKLGEFDYLDKELFETEYGVSGLVKEKKREFKDRFTGFLVAGISLCILSVIPMFILGFIEDGKYACIGVAILLGMVAVGAYLIVTVGQKMGAYSKLLQEGDYEKEKKQNYKYANALTSSYWLVATAVYLLLSFLTNAWNFTWIVWVVAGVLFPVYNALVNAILTSKRNK